MSPGLPGVISSTEPEDSLESGGTKVGCNWATPSLLLSLLIVTYQLSFFIIKLDIVFL